MSYGAAEALNARERFARAVAVAIALVAAPAPAASAAAPPQLESRLAQTARVHANAGAEEARAAARRRGLPVVDGGVRIVAEVPARAVASFRHALRAAGGRTEAQYHDLHQVVAGFGSLERLAEVDGVRIRPPHEPVPQAIEAGAIAATGSAAWLGTGIQGAGVKVAVIDRGFWHWQDRIAEGDLPAATGVKSYCERLEDVTHGSAMAEAVHDQAPLAELVLICIDTDVELGLAKDYAREQGADVIVSALSFFGTSRGDGSGGPSTPEGIAADANASGILWVAAAGNQGQQHWGGNFTDADRDHWHEWSAGADEGNWPILDQYRQGCFYLRWEGWPTTTRDLDLYAMVGPDYNVPIAKSENRQSAGGLPPTETICLTGDTRGVDIRVFDRSAANANAGADCKRCTPPSQPPVRIDLDYDATEWPGRPALEHWNSARSLAEPAGSPVVLAVGAHCVQTGELEPYSSRGPTPDGRIKPDLTAPDTDIVATSPYGIEGGCGISGFMGTSAAAASAAGLAANVKSARPELTPDGVRLFLRQRALDEGAAGPDNDWGAGRLWLRAFSDVNPNAAYAGAAEELYRRRIVTPGAGGGLDPTAAVTRAQMAEYVLRAMEHHTHLPAHHGYYSDMPAGDPRTPWVEHLREHGIADVTSGAFRPDDAITHVEAAGFLQRASPGAELPPSSTPAAALTRAEMVVWVAAAWDMRWFQHLPLGLVDDAVVVGDRVWFTHEGNNTVDSYNFRTGRLEGPIGVGSRPRELDATADGSRLVVTNTGSYDVSVVDTTERRELRRIPVPRGDYGETPYSVAVAANGKALISTTTYSYSGFSSHIYAIDPGSGAVTLRTDLVPGSFGTTTEVTYLSASGDRGRVFFVAGNISSGDVWAYDSATDAMIANGALGTFAGYIASDRHGARVAVAPTPALFDGTMAKLRSLAMPQAFGIALSPGATRIYAGRRGGVTFYDAATDAPLTRRPLADTIEDALWRNYIYTPVARMAIDPAGRTLAVVTDHGLTLLPTGLSPSEADAAAAAPPPPAPGGDPDPPPSDPPPSDPPPSDPLPSDPPPAPGEQPADGSDTLVSPLTPPSIAPDSDERPATAPLVSPRVVRRPRILGTLTTGSRLRATAGLWRGTGPLRLRFSWQRCDARGRRCRSIGVSTRSYRLQARDDGKFVRVVVTARGPGGRSAAASRPRGPVQ